MNKNLIFYACIAIAIAVVAYAAVSLLANQERSISLVLAHTTTTGLFPYNTTRFFIIVNNTGNNYISGLLVGFYVNDQVYHSYNVSIPQGKAATIPVNFTYPVAGNYSFEAVVDPGRLSRLSDYNATHVLMYVRISDASKPDPFSSIPSNGIESSYSFNFPGSSVGAASLMYSSYDTVPANWVFSPMHGMLYGLSRNLYSTFNATYGAVANYSDGSSAVSVWLQGVFSESSLLSIIRSYGFREVDSVSHEMFYMSGDSTLCVSYSKGWTKLVSYTSSAATCGSMPADTVSANVPQSYSTAFRPNSPIMAYTGNFLYTNSTVLATQYGIGNSSKYTATWFAVANGLFVSYVNESASNLLSNTVCYGLLSNGTVCSEYIFPKVNTSTTRSSSLILSREIVGNYLLSLYSWVGNNSELDANYNAAMLLGALSANAMALKWKSAYADSCSFNSTYQIGCNVTSFDSSTHIASIKLQNLGNESIKVNYAACYTPGMQLNETVNGIMTPNGSLAFNLMCRYLALLPAIGIQNSYLFYLNYSRGGRNSSIIGFLNTSNIV